MVFDLLLAISGTCNDSVFMFPLENLKGNGPCAITFSISGESKCHHFYYDIVLLGGESGGYHDMKVFLFPLSPSHLFICLFIFSLFVCAFYCFDIRNVKFLNVILSLRIGWVRKPSNVWKWSFPTCGALFSLNFTVLCWTFLIVFRHFSWETDEWVHNCDWDWLITCDDVSVGSMTYVIVSWG